MRHRPTARRLRDFAGDGARGLRSRARTPAERLLPVEFRSRAEEPHAPQGPCFPGRFALDRLDAITTVREFDDVYTAPHFGFKNASDYYYRASAMRVIDRVRVPARIITAEDDPFVPTAPFRDATVVRTRTSMSPSRRTAATAGSLPARATAATATGRNTRSSPSPRRTPHGYSRTQRERRYAEQESG